ncbi:hypothetical protein C8J56DRAFT_1168462 [Mycena floridula]|nr:hypothetical protein C8J56DRAFT_1168462 [Mycena floridula]
MLLSCVFPSTMKNPLKRLFKRKNKNGRHATELVPFPAPALAQLPATDPQPVGQNGAQPQAPGALNEARAEPVHVLPRAPAQPYQRDGPAEPVPFVDGPVEQFAALNPAPTAERFQAQEALLVPDGARMVEGATVVDEPVSFLDGPPEQVVALNEGPLPSQNRVQAQVPQVPNGAGTLEPAPVAPHLQHHAHTVNGPIPNSQPSGSSTNLRATYAGIKNCLDAVSKLAFPGIGTAASGVRIAMENVQAQRQVQIELGPLQEHMEHIWFCIHSAQSIPGALKNLQLFAPLERQLNRLAVDIEAAVQQNRIAAFFNGTDDLAKFASHQKDIDSYIQTLMFSIAISTNQELNALCKQRDEAVTIFRAESPSEEPQGMITTMSDTKFGDIEGGAFINNKVDGDGRMVTNFKNTTFGNIRGGFMRDNHIRANTTPM